MTKNIKIPIHEGNGKRKTWVDIVKGIAIIAVVLGHISFEYPAWRLFPISSLFVWLWHVGVFFMIGGFF